jgi:hypothetical protein
MPVIFYAAYNRKLLVDLTREVRELPPGAEIANSIFELLPKVVSTLAESRSKPIVAGVKKPTSPYLATESEHTAG